LDHVQDIAKFLPTFALNREIGQLAERIRFRYLFSMAKWRGFGGATDFWKYSIESTTLMTGLAPYVPTLRLIASVAPVIIHPAVFAKMAATMDDVAGGRIGINIVSAGNPGEYTQMGLYPDNFEDFRYDYTEEWLMLVKRLWREDSVTHAGRYFTLEDCESWPKPLQDPLPIVCATSSERGYRFIAEQCTDGFFGGTSIAQKKATSLRIKEVAAEHGRSVRTHTLVMLIQGDSDSEAQRIYDHYRDGADLEAIASVYGKRAGSAERYADERARLFYGGVPFIGGPESVAAMIEELSLEGKLDGMMFVFPDFIEGLSRFGENVMPLLRRRGIIAASEPRAASPV
jgi:pyrimidine oxygenase